MKTLTVTAIIVSAIFGYLIGLWHQAAQKKHNHPCPCMEYHYVR